MKLKNGLSVVMMAWATLSISANAQTVWLHASDGFWSDSAAWTDGVPDGNAANLTNTSASYAVTVDTPPATPYGDLSVSNGIGQTTRLNINAAGFNSTNGVLRFGRGAEVLVNSGGVMNYKGASSAYPFVEIKDGGLWRVAGGTIDFSDLPPSSGSGRSYIYIGNSSTGKMQIASGRFNFTGSQGASGTNTSMLFGVGTGTGGRGYFDMTGGVAVIGCYPTAGGNVAFSVGRGSRSLGFVTLANDAQLTISNWLQIGEAAATGNVTVADNASLVFTGRLKLGCATNALGVLTVRDNGCVDATKINASVYLAGYDDSSRGGVATLNISGGRARTGMGVTLCRSRSVSSGYAEVNLSGGEWILGEGSSYGVTVGISDTATAGGVARARVNISGGLLDLSRAMWNTPTYLQGLIVGHVSVTGAIPPSAIGEIIMCGGTVTNSGQFAIGAGVGGTGTVIQTGGVMRQGMGWPGVSCYPMTLGWGGGCGTYHLASGLFESGKPVYVGGITASDLGYVPGQPSFMSNAVGVLRIDGGLFTITEANLYLGSFGSGTLVIGAQGSCSAKDIVLRDNTSSTLRFEFGTDGGGTLTAEGSLQVGPGAKLEVDTTAYRGSASHHRLIGCATRTGSFAPEHISITGPGTVAQDKDDDVWLCFSDDPVTNHVSLTGSDRNDGTADRPWATLKHAMEQTTLNGDTVSLGSGTFRVSRTDEYGLRLAPGVNLIGAGQDKTVITLEEQPTNRVSRLLDLSSSPVMTNGNQTVAHFTLDGCAEGAVVGIRCYYRHNVTFRDLTVRNCYQQGLYLAGAPADVLWPSQPPDSVYCSNLLVCACTIANNGLWSTNVNWAYGGLELHQVKDSEVVYCLLDERVKGGWPVKGAWVKNVDIHNCDAWVCPASVKAQRDFSMELFYMIGCEIFDNRCNGSFSMPLCSEVRIHHNDVRSGIGGKPSYCVEWGGFNSTVDHNYFEGMGSGIGAWSWGTNLFVGHNVMRACTNAVMFLGAVSTTGAGFNDIKVFNNTFDRCGELWNGGPLTFRSQTNVFVSRIDIRNNVIMNSPASRAALCLTGMNGGTSFAEFVTNTLVANNLFFNNPGGNILNNNTLDVQVGTNLYTDPLMPAAGDRPAPYYECGSNSPCFGAGADVGLPFLQSAPDIGAYVRTLGERVEAEMGFSVATEAGSAPIAVEVHGLASFKAVRLPDAGDEVRLHFRIKERGVYCLRARVRAGDAEGATRLLDSGYRFHLVREPIVLSLETGSLSEVDPVENCSWGTLQGVLTLSEGLHHLRVTAVSPEIMLDYFSVAPFNGTLLRVW